MTRTPGRRLGRLATTLLALGSAMAMPAALHAQATMTATDQMLLDLIEQQQQQIEALRRELDALRAGRPPDEVLLPAEPRVQQARP